MVQVSILTSENSSLEKQTSNLKQDNAELKDESDVMKDKMKDCCARDNIVQSLLKVPGKTAEK